MSFLSRVAWLGVVNFSLVSCIQNEATPFNTTEQASVRSGAASPKPEETRSLIDASLVPAASPDLASFSVSASTLPPVSALSLTPVGAEGVAPSVVTFSPAYASDPSRVKPMPMRIVVTMSEAVTLSPQSPFVLTGCQVLPAVLGLAVNGAAITLQLSDGGCVGGETLVVTFDPTTVLGATGTPGVAPSISRSYTLSTTGPSVALTMPSPSLLNGNSISTIPVVYKSAGTVSRPTTFSRANIQSTGDAGVSCAVSFVPGTDPSGDTLSLSTCKGDGAFSVSLSGGTAQDEVGNLSNNSNTLFFSVQTTGPTYARDDAQIGPVRQLPTGVKVYFSMALLHNSDLRTSLPS